MNILSLKNNAQGYTFRAMVPSGVGDSWDGSYVDDGQGGGLINANSAPASDRVQVQTGEDQYGNVIWGEQDAKAPEGLQGAYEPGQEMQYVKDLQTTLDSGTGRKAASLETGEDTWQGYKPATSETFTPEQAVELYNRMDPRLANDPAMAAQLAKANQYFAKEGNFVPGGEGATAKNLTDFIAQDKIDAASRQAATQAVGLTLVGGIAGGAMLAGAGAGGATVGEGANMANTAQQAFRAGELANAASAGETVAASGGAASGATSATSGGGGSVMNSANQFLSSPVGKLAAGQGVGLLAKAASGGGYSNQSGLINSTLNSQQNQQSQNAKPTVINYYGTPASQTAAQAQPKTIATANASMYSKGSGWAGAISKYQNSKLG